MHIYFRLLLLLSIALFSGCAASVQAQKTAAISRVEPPHWYVGMENPNLQILLYGLNIAAFEPSLTYPGVEITEVTRVDNPNYLFVQLRLAPESQPGQMTFELTQGKRKFKQNYELKPRRFENNVVNGFGPQDLLYLIMPDRFANGNPKNDSIKGMNDTRVNRKDERARHGGDLAGIRSKLDYLQELGVTALWLNPVQENNQPHESYHGYAMTDLYKIDPRLGTNAEYVALVAEMKQRDLKMVMDLVHNHLGNEHWLMRDLPSKDWVHNWPTFTRTNYRAITQLDPYAAQGDSKLMREGWFDNHMPDLNQ